MKKLMSWKTISNRSKMISKFTTMKSRKNMIV